MKNKKMITIGIAILGLFISILSTAFSQTWIQQFPTGTPPGIRYSAGNAYDAINDRLILFSGETPSGLPRPTDVWVLVNASGLGGTPAWVQLSPSGGPPMGKVWGTVIYDQTSNRVIVHGGCSANCGYAIPETWVLTNANGLGGTPNWIQLPNIPWSGAREGHSAIYDPASNRMILFGGEQAYPNTNINDVWVLTDANGIGTPAWMQLFPTGTLPLARMFHGAVYDQTTNSMIVFGGQNFTWASGLTVLNDVWVLTNANGLGGTPQWIQLSPSGTLPLVRGGMSVAYDPVTNRMVTFGGYDQRTGDPYGAFNDVWVLTRANGNDGTPEWIQLNPAGGPPTARLFHSAGYSSSSNRMVIAMGRNDRVSPYMFNDVWVLTNANGIALPTAEINIIAALHTVGTGTKPGSTKTPLALDLKIFDKNIGGSPDPKDFGTIWESGTGLTSPLIGKSGPTVISFGGGQANSYTLTVPAVDPTNTFTSGSYLVIGKVTLGSNTLYVGSPTDPVTIGSITQKHLQVIQNGNGKPLTAKTTAVPGSLLLIAEPAFLEFTSTEELLPIVYESVDGDWNITVRTDPPEGFISTPGTMSTSVSDSNLQVLQFRIKDVGSSWTSTRLIHYIRHKGKNTIITSNASMVNKQKKSAGQVVSQLDNASSLESKSVPSDYVLYQNYPDPFNPTTKIKYEIPKTTFVTIKVFNLLGQEVLTLVSEKKEAGSYEVQFDGSKLSSGLYLCRLASGDFIATKKLILMK